MDFSNFNQNSNSSLTSMSKRLGILATPPPKIKIPKDENGEPLTPVDLEGLDHMKTLLENQGGHLQQERMIFDKRRTLDRAVLYSYQGALILKDGLDEVERPFHALMNPNKNKADYDEKILSVGYEYGIKPGDTFEWCNTKTHWIVYLQDLTELAYFRGNVRRCSYKISWQDGSSIGTSYAAIRGPVETQIQFIQKHQISVDEPNYSLNIIMPKTDETIAYFKRYSKFYLQGLDDDYQKEVCWRVEAVDSVSTPGILEIGAEEYYSNKEVDDLDDRISLEDKTDENIDFSTTSAIGGNTLILPKTSYTYSYSGTANGTWSASNKNVIIEVDSTNPKKITLRWKDSVGGTFKLYYGNIEKTIKVKSLF